MRTFQRVHFIGLCCIIYIGQFLLEVLNILMILVLLELLLFVRQAGARVRPHMHMPLRACTHAHTLTHIYTLTKFGFMLIPILDTLLDHK